MRATSERAALDQIVDELCVDRLWGSSVLKTTQDEANWLRGCVRPLPEVQTSVKELMLESDLAARGSISEDDFYCEVHGHCPTWASMIDTARRTYLGRYYSTSSMLELPSATRINLVPVYDAINDQVVAYWIDPTHNVDRAAGGYELSEDAFGKRRGLETLNIRCQEAFISAHQITVKILDKLKDSDKFACGYASNGRPASVKHEVRGRIHAGNGLRDLLNPAAGASYADEEQSKALRGLLLRRWQSLSRANHLHKLLSTASAEAKKVHAQEGAKNIMDVFVDVDQWKAVVDFMDDDRSVACLLRVLIGASDRVDGKLAPDQEVVELLHGRLPHLHIYESPGVFPHYVAANGDCHCYTDRYVEVCIGFVTTRLRDTLRKQRLEAEYHPPISNAEFAADERRIRDTPGLTAGMIQNERHTALVANGHDFGYDPDENLVRVLNADVWSRQLSGKPRRRVKNDGWSVRKVVTSADMQYVTRDTSTLFSEAPTLTLKLVNAETGELVDADAPYGGLEPDKWLRQSDDIRLNTNPPNLWSTHIPRNDAESQQIRSLGGNIATRVLVKPTVLASAHAGAKFKIVVEATAKHRTTGTAVRLQTASKPMTFFSDKRAQSAVVGRKRKPVDPTATR